MKDCLLLVFANKQDLPGGSSSPARPTEADRAAMSPQEVTDRLGLQRMRDRSWCVRSCALRAHAAGTVIPATRSRATACSSAHIGRESAS